MRLAGEQFTAESEGIKVAIQKIRSRESQFRGLLSEQMWCFVSLWSFRWSPGELSMLIAGASSSLCTADKNASVYELHDVTVRSILRTVGELGPF